MKIPPRLRVRLAGSLEVESHVNHRFGAFRAFVGRVAVRGFNDIQRYVQFAFAKFKAGGMMVYARKLSVGVAKALNGEVVDDGRLLERLAA